MRLPDPIANTTTEAYLAYKAGVLAEGDLKPKLYEPYIHLDAWLAYWTGLAADYPKKPTVNLFDKNKITVGVRVSTSTGRTYPQAGYAISSFIPVSPLTTYVLVCGTAAGGSFFSCYDSSKHYISGSAWQDKRTWKTPANARYIKFDFKESEKDIVQFEKAPLSPYSPYTGEPEMLTDEEAYIAYLSGVTDTYPEEFRDPADVRVAAYLRYLISARFGRPEYPVTNEELYLSMLKTQYIPSGDPSSDIVIDGTAKAPFVDVKMYGDTFQQSYTGQNLYNVATLQTGASVTKDNDGWITVTKDNSSGSSASYTNIWTANLNLEPNTQYAIILEIKEASGTGELDITSTNSTQGQFSSWQSRQVASLVAGQVYKVTPTTKSSFSGVYGGLRTLLNLQAGQSASITFRLSVLADTSVAPSGFVYEPYVGGQPSPSPDYPQPIQTVTGEQTITVTGKNLFNAEAIPYVAKRAYTSDGSVVNWTNYTGTDEYQPVEPNTEYTIWNNKARDTTYLCEYDENKNFIRRTVEATTFTTTATTKYLRWSIYVGAGEIPPTQTQLELGATASSFEPYAKHDYPLDLGTIELCKLGTYQDYIWKDGEDWKVHKECDSGTSDIHINGIDINSSGTSTASRVGSFCSLRADNPSIDYDNTLGRAIASENIGIYKLDASVIGNAAAESMQDGTFCQRQGTNDRVYFKNSAYAGKTGEEIRAIIAAQLGGTNYWYPLATPTDTTITDQNLIAQLEALVNGGAENGTTYIKVNATDPNLPGLLYVEAPKYD